MLRPQYLVAKQYCLSNFLNCSHIQIVFVALFTFSGCHSSQIDDSNTHADNSIRFEIRSNFGEETNWVEPFLRDASMVLIELFNNPQVKAPEKIIVELTRNTKLTGLYGYAMPGKLAFSSNLWEMDRYRLWLLSHELANLFAAHYGCGGYPSDWWSNGRSPFPEYTSCLVLQRLGYQREAEWRKSVFKDQPDHRLFWELHEPYGFALFAEFFKLIHNDGIELLKIGDPWPAPDKLRTMYTATYLSIAARRNITDDLIRCGIGIEPHDWDERHPELTFIEYSFDFEEIDQLIQIRNGLFIPKSNNKLRKARRLFRSGHYEAANNTQRF